MVSDPWIKTLKVTLTFALASLATFLESPLTDSLSSYSYFVAIAVLFFHPARSIGAMIEALLCCVIGLTLGYAVAQTCLEIVDWFDNHQKSMWGAHLISIVALLGVTFVLAYVRAKYSPKRAAIGTACSLVHILTFNVITQMSLEDALPTLPWKINLICINMLLGTLLSFLGCCLLWPQTASYQLQSQLKEMMLLYQDFFFKFSNSFLPVIDGVLNNDAIVEQELDSFIKKQDALLVIMETSRFETRFEIFSNMAQSGSAYKKIFELNDHLALHSGSLKSTMVSILNNQRQHEQEWAKEFITRLIPLMTQICESCGTIFSILSHCFSPDRKNADGILRTLDHWLSTVDDLIVSFHISHKKAFLEALPDKHNVGSYHLFFFVFGFQEMLVTLKDLMQVTMQLLVDRLHQNASLIRQRSSANVQSLLSTTDTHISQGIQSIEHPSRFVQALWDFASSFRLYEFKFALKTAVTVTLMAIPAFLDATQALFYEYKMSWSMSSAIVVMTFSVGGTNAAGLYRILGTIAGALISIPIWLMFSDNPIGLFFACGVVGLFGFYLFFQTPYPKIGRIFLLTFSIILLQKYAVLEDPIRDQNYTISELAFRRGFAVMFGVIIGLLVSWFIWPFRARTAVRKGISRIYQDMSTLLIKLVGLMNSKDSIPDQKTMRDFLRAEIALRVAWSEAAASLKDTDHERRFKGVFPKETYSKILTSIESILDRFESIRLSVGKEEFRPSSSTPPEIKCLFQELIGQVLLYFYVLSGAMQLKTPLPPQLPDISGARERLIRGVQRVQSDSLYLAYVLEEIIDDLHLLGSYTKVLLGEVVPISIV